ncbi:MAG TPA: response regulator transcription factor [Acidimicrobiia bacterium]|nr:response regulator transcription factor [Acidimicrobiia bacterium]
MIRILIADDQAMVRSGLRMILESEIDLQVVDEAENGVQAVRLVKRERPDVVLMDVRMPEMDGLEATRQIAAEAPDSRVIVLTTFDIDEYVYGALRAGASGFLLKDAPADDLIAAIRVVAGGDALLAPSVTKRIIEKFAAGPDPDRAVQGLDDLTEREVEVLRLVARGLSNAEIAAELFVSEATVKTHVSHILTKLGLRDRVQAVVAAYESGLTVPGL